MISEYSPDTVPQRYFFPQRNSIISGLCEVTIVVQAGNSSGALITAECSADQGRDVCAVPGNVDSQYNMGSNKLIKEGAIPVLSPGDVFELLGVNTEDDKETGQVSV